MNELSTYLIENRIMFSFYPAKGLRTIYIANLTEDQGAAVLQIAETEGLLITVKDGLVATEPEE